MDEYTGSPTVNRRGLTRSDGLGLPPVDSSSSIGVESPSSSSFNGDSPARPHHSFRRCEPTLLASTFSTAYMGASASKANLASADLDDTDVAAITGDVPGYQDFVVRPQPSSPGPPGTSVLLAQVIHGLTRHVHSQRISPPAPPPPGTTASAGCHVPFKPRAAWWPKA